MTTLTQPTKFEQTHITLVLDRSGSMSVCQRATVDSVNKYLKEARGDAAMKESDFALLQFDSQSIDKVNRFCGPPCNMPDLTYDDFVPRGGTPLYDAIGRGIDNLDAATKASGSGKAILVIVTDGEENSSRKYTHSAITELIKARQNAGWLVIFLGAGLDVAKIGVGLGITRGAVASYAQDAASMDCMATETSSMSRGYAMNSNTAEAKQWLASGQASFSAAARQSMGDATGGSWQGQPNPSAPTPPPADPTLLNKPGTPVNTTDAWGKDLSDDVWKDSTI